MGTSRERRDPCGEADGRTRRTLVGLQGEKQQQKEKRSKKNPLKPCQGLRRLQEGGIVP